MSRHLPIPGASLEILSAKEETNSASASKILRWPWLRRYYRDFVWRQCARHVALVVGKTFYSNAEAATTDKCQQVPSESAVPKAWQRKLFMGEQSGLMLALEQKGIRYTLFEVDPHLDTPDAGFPNHFAFLPDITGRVYLVAFPMHHPSRQREAEHPYFRHLLETYRAKRRLLDFSRYQSEFIDPADPSAGMRACEGTAATAFDHLNRRMYRCVSKRSDGEIAREIAQRFGYENVMDITSYHKTVGEPDAVFYHQDLVMHIGAQRKKRQETYSLITPDAIRDEKERDALIAERENLDGRNNTLFITTEEAENEFAANLRQVESYRDGKLYLIMSTSARHALERGGRLGKLMEFNDGVIHYDLDLGQEFGGGGGCCNVGEWYGRFTLAHLPDLYPFIRPVLKYLIPARRYLWNFSN